MENKYHLNNYNDFTRNYMICMGPAPHSSFFFIRPTLRMNELPMAGRTIHNTRFVWCYAATILPYITYDTCAVEQLLSSFVMILNSRARSRSSLGVCMCI